MFINVIGFLDFDFLDSSKLEFKWYCYNIIDRLKIFNYLKMLLFILVDVFSEFFLLYGCFGNNGLMVVNFLEIIFF